MTLRGDDETQTDPPTSFEVQLPNESIRRLNALQAETIKQLGAELSAVRQQRDNAQAENTELHAKLAHFGERNAYAFKAIDDAEARAVAAENALTDAEILLTDALTIRMCADPWGDWDSRCERFLRRNDSPEPALGAVVGNEK